jgi:hypothetical protein
MTMRFGLGAMLAVLLTGCGTLRTAEEMRAAPAGTHEFTTTRDAASVVGILTERLRKCHAAQYYGVVGVAGFKTGETVLEQQVDAASGRTTLDVVTYAALGPQALLSATVVPRDGGALVHLDYGMKSMRKPALAAQRWVEEGYAKCR